MQGGVRLGLYIFFVDFYEGEGNINGEIVAVEGYGGEVGKLGERG